MIFIGLGSSIGDAAKTFNQAELFFKVRGVQVLKKSGLLKNPPQGGMAQNEFTNAVWKIDYPEAAWERFNWCLLPKRRRLKLKAKKLLALLQRCENAAGRDRSVRWADRTLDLDILMFHELVVDSTRLNIPHPQIPARQFVVQPWSELVDKNFEIPKFGKLANLLKNLN